MRVQNGRFDVNNNQFIKISISIYNNKLTIINRKMGTQASKSSSIIDAKFLKSLSLSTPLKSVDQEQTEVHEINSLSSEHQQIMLQKIRIKKNYDCPYIIKIIDSHTLQSKSLCSTIIKTYIVLEKPQSLSEEINQRIQLNIGFQQSQLWTLIYSCCLGAKFLVKNNVCLARLNPNKIFIDLKGAIKMNDPDFYQGSLASQRTSESQFIQSLSQIADKLMSYKSNNYSKKLIQLVQLMSKDNNSLEKIQNWIKINYLDSKKINGTLQLFSSAKKASKHSKSKSRSKKMIKVTSGRKIAENKSNQNFSSSVLSSFLNSSEYKINQDKQNKESNQLNIKRRQNIQLFTFKDPLKQLDNLEKQISFDTHLFPRKALFGNKRKNKQKLRETGIQQRSDIKLEQSPGQKYWKRQTITRESKSISRVMQTEQSLDSSQMLNIISYQVDQQTYVRQVCQEQSQYFLQLMNQCKNSHKSFRNQLTN